MNEAAMLAYMKSIDERLTRVDINVDALIQNVITRHDCENCQRRWIPRRYIGMMTGAFTGLAGIAALVGDWFNIGKTLNNLFK